jgi:hypothetical protein
MKNSISRSGLEVVMLLEGGTPHLADEPRICPTCVVCIASTTPTDSFATA